MEQKVYEMLVKMQASMEEMNERLKKVEGNVRSVEETVRSVEETVRSVEGNVKNVEETVKSVEETVNRIEAAQTEDVLGMLKVTKKKTDFEVEYLNNKLTEMDKRLFTLEKRIEN